VRIYLDDDRETPNGYERTYTAPETIALLEDCFSKGVLVEVLSLDHDLGEGDCGNGYDVLLWLEEKIALYNYSPPEKINIHSANLGARVKMELAIESIGRLSKK
jgi:hypothetical protein